MVPSSDSEEAVTVKYAFVDLPTRVDAAVANAARAEAAGLDRYLVPQVERADPIAVLAVVADRVPRIELATSVIVIQSTLPQHLAQQARTVDQVSGGRFTLGIGVCHQPIVTEAFGLEWNRPYSHMVQYLDALLPLLDGQATDVSGDLVSARTAIEVPGPTPRVMLAAMGPKMLRLAAQRTEGTILAWTGPRTIADHVRPVIGDALISAVVWVCVTDDPDGARDRIGRQLAGYRTLPSYQAMSERERVADMMDLLVIGNADEVRAELARYAAASADEIAMIPQGTPAERELAWSMIEEGFD